MLEAAELLEHFQWREADEVLDDKEQKQELAFELVDVLYWVAVLADALEIDLSETLRQKIKKTSKRYPVEKLTADLPQKESLRRYYELKKGKKGKSDK